MALTLIHKPNTFIILFLLIQAALLLFVAAASMEGTENRGYTSFQLVITNALGPQLGMAMECKSNADHIDLGMRVVKAGKSYKWSFHPDGVQVNQFFCYFNWKDSKATFQVFDYQRDKARCGKDRVCKWIVKTDGVHGLGTPALFWPWPRAL
ncbi:hypothetical protein Dimus_009894 [Dionaea muscipula]